MKYTRLDDEIEMYESREDKIVLGLTILAVVISIALILWNPDVEAIGTWVYNFIN